MTAVADHERRMFRAALSPDAVLPIDDVLVALPGNPDDTHRWLIERVTPLGAVLGEPLFRWGDVLAAATTDAVTAVAPAEKSRDHDDGPFGIAAAAVVLGVSRASLDRAIRLLRVDQRPPVAPSRGGGNRVRYVFRDEAHVHEWWADVSAPPAASRAAPTVRRAAERPGLGEGIVDFRSVLPRRRAPGTKGV